MHICDNEITAASDVVRNESWGHVRHSQRVENELIKSMRKCDCQPIELKD